MEDAITRPLATRGACLLACLTALLVTATAAAAPARAGQSTLGEGGWSWFADPRAVHYEGLHRRTYVGWVNERGDIEVSAYDHDTLTRTTAVVQDELQVDDHSNPALLLRPDGRLLVFYSVHNGDEMRSRLSADPEDVSSWQPPEALTSNTPGPRGYTYPNPIWLRSERRTYLFWRGGNWNPSYATRADGASGWSQTGRLIIVPGQRPYVKYDSSGGDTIHFAFTNAHPREAGDVNIYYAAYRRGAIQRADGTRVGRLGEPITPAQADTVYDTSDNAWIHDVAADSSGRPVIVFATFPSPTDHRYMYARWTGRRWVDHEIIRAGGSISTDPREPQYSAGITLDHEDPSTVYLSRDVDGTFEVETWRTRDGGATWSREAVTAHSASANVRPVSPRGLLPFSGDLSVIWMRGIYDTYVTYQTSIATLLARGGNQPPIAHLDRAPAAGAAPLDLTFDATASSDADGSVVDWAWDFGDGAQGAGARARHTYTAPGRYFPKLTVTDDGGSKDVCVAEVVVG